MVCLGYFLTVSCEKNVDFFKKNNQHFLKIIIFDWSEFLIRLVFVIFKKIINISKKNIRLVRIGNSYTTSTNLRACREDNFRSDLVCFINSENFFSFKDAST